MFFRDQIRSVAQSCPTLCQASLSITNSRSSLRLTSIESVMPSSHLILCHPLLLLPPIPPSIRVFSSNVFSFLENSTQKLKYDFVLYFQDRCHYKYQETVNFPFLQSIPVDIRQTKLLNHKIIASVFKLDGVPHLAQKGPLTEGPWVHLTPQVSPHAFRLLVTCLLSPPLIPGILATSPQAPPPAQVPTRKDVRKVPGSEVSR